MIRRPPTSTPGRTLFHYTTLFRSKPLELKHNIKSPELKHEINSEKKISSNSNTKKIESNDDDDLLSPYVFEMNHVRNINDTKLRMTPYAKMLLSKNTSGINIKLNNEANVKENNNIEVNRINEVNTRGLGREDSKMEYKSPDHSKNINIEKDNKSIGLRKRFVDNQTLHCYDYKPEFRYDLNAKDKFLLKTDNPIPPNDIPISKTDAYIETNDKNIDNQKVKPICEKTKLKFQDEESPFLRMRIQMRLKHNNEEIVPEILKSPIKKIDTKTKVDVSDSLENLSALMPHIVSN